MDISSITTSADMVKASQEILRSQDKTGSFQSALEKAVQDNDKEEIKKACVEFETYFIQTLFKEMRKTVDTSSRIVPQSMGENIFQEMLDEETSKNAAKSGGFGIADMMYRQLTGTGFYRG